MVTVKLYGALRLRCGLKEMTFYASSVKEACQLLARATGVDMKEFKKSSFFINGKEVKVGAALNAGDELVLLAPPQGGLVK